MSDFPKSLRDSVRKGSAIPFVGSGVTLRVRRRDGSKVFPSRQEFLMWMVDRLNDEKDPVSADLIKHFANRVEIGEGVRQGRRALAGRWKDFLKDVFAPPREEIDDTSLLLARAIWKLNDLVVTTNYDQVLEWSHPGPESVEILDPLGLERALDHFGQGLPLPSLCHVFGTANEANSIFAFDYVTSDLPDAGHQERVNVSSRVLRRLFSGHWNVIFIGSNAPLDARDLFGQADCQHYWIALEGERRALQDRVDLLKLPIQVVGVESYDLLPSELGNLAASRSSIRPTGHSSVSSPDVGRGEVRQVTTSFDNRTDETDLRDAKDLEDLRLLCQSLLRDLAPARDSFVGRDELAIIIRVRHQGAKLVYRYTPWLVDDWNRSTQKSVDPRLTTIETISGEIPVASLLLELSDKLAVLESVKEQSSNSLNASPKVPSQYGAPPIIDNKRDGMPSAKKSAQKEMDSADVVIVCALHKPELEKVEAAGKAKWQQLPAHRTDPHVYIKTTYTTSRGNKISVVASAPNQMGLSASGVLATKMILRFRPKLVAMVGIAAGASSAKQGYGNILAADTTFDYGSGKLIDNKGVIEFQPDPMPLPIDTRLKSLLKNWESRRTGLDEIYRAWQAEKPQTILNLHVGPLGSGGSVVDAPQQLQEVQTHWRKLIGIEMEAYAVHRACHDTLSPEPKFLCLKSICDFAQHKADNWQHYAAYTAAEFCYHFLTQEWESLFPSESQQED